MAEQKQNEGVYEVIVEMQNEWGEERYYRTLCQNFQDVLSMMVTLQMKMLHDVEFQGWHVEQCIMAKENVVLEYKMKGRGVE